MVYGSLAHDPDDESYLDLLFDEMLDRLEQGLTIDPELLALERPHLRTRVESLAEMAWGVRRDDGRPLPRIPGYELVRELGRGGMGAVYLARQERLGGRPVAIKVLPAGAALSPKARERFRAEAAAIAAVRHPNIVAVHDVLLLDGLHAFAMEWIDGSSLADWIREHGSAAGRIGFAVRVGIAVARALAAVHDAGLLHRDVKPSNILLRSDETPMLGDFGLVQPADHAITQTGHFAGTAAYASPEQLRGDREGLDRRSDVYALGVTLHHLLAGRPPFPDANLAERLSCAERGATPLRRLDRRIPRDLETIVAKAMEADPARRYQTAGDLADDLERLLDHKPIRARPAGLVDRAAKLVRRRRATVVAALVGGCAAALVLVALGVWLFLVPSWVANHLRTARLALLNQGQAVNIASALVWGTVNQRNETDDRALRASLDVALGHYDAALRLAPRNAAIRRERAVVEAVHRGLESPFDDPRSLGLHAFLILEPTGAMTAWTRHLAEADSTAEPDGLVEAALGIMHLFKGEPARAYPRLRMACRALPSVGFLTIYQAEAAIRCGDLEVGERLLDAAIEMPLASRYSQARVRAILRAAQGRDEEADRLFLGFVTEVSRLDRIDFLLARARHAEALVEAASCYASAKGPRAAAALVDAAGRWWASLSEPERSRLEFAPFVGPRSGLSPTAYLRMLAEHAARVLDKSGQAAGAATAPSPTD